MTAAAIRNDLDSIQGQLDVRRVRSEEFFAGLSTDGGIVAFENSVTNRTRVLTRQ